MKNTLTSISCLFLLWIGAYKVSAQQIIPVSGGNTGGTAGSVSYTVGQLIYTSSTDEKASSNPGVQVPVEVTTTAVNDAIEGSDNIVVYPNPVVSSITLKQPHLESIAYELYDINGKKIITHSVTTDETIINMETLAAGSYILTVSNKQGLIKTFNLIKH